MTRRTIRLHRAPTLAALRHALVTLIPLDDLAAARATAVVLPTRSAAMQFQRTIGQRLRPGQGAVLPDLVTRRDLYDRLYERALDPPRRLGDCERDVLMKAAAHAAVTDGATPPFQLRAGLIGEIVALYDAIRRQRQTLADFDRLVVERLEAESGAGEDVGAERMLRQSRFLSVTFRAYESALARAEAVDEHGFREWLLAHGPARPYERLVVAVHDAPRDPNGLWSADFDLLALLPGLRAVDLVVTESQLGAGLYERLHDMLPGLEVQHVPPPEVVFDAPRLLVPHGSGSRLFRSRDREEELRDLVRRIRAARGDPDRGAPLSRIAVVFERPLPYVYLAGSIFAAGGVPVQARDALPLAAEPFAAAIDLVLGCASARFSRTALVALLASPHFRFVHDEVEVTRADVHALDAALQETEHYGDAERLDALADDWREGRSRSRYAAWDAAAASRAAAAAAAVVRNLAPLLDQGRASAQMTRLREFVVAHARPVPHADPLRASLLRAQSAVLSLLAGIADAHRAHHDLLWDLADLSSEVRRWIEARTFAPETGDDGGVQLLDAAAAPFGEFDVVHLVGLVDGEWPGHAARNIFYSPSLLRALGWPDEDADPLARARAAFVDLLQAPVRAVSVSTFTLEDDALVETSVLAEDIPRAGLTALPVTAPLTDVFLDEALARRPVPLDALPPEVRTWAAHRTGRPDPRRPEFHGTTSGVALRPRSVSALDTYAQCPFRFFARYVLRLPEERPEQDGLTPLERGRFQHEFFQAFFDEWKRQGGGAITADRLDAARAIAFEVAERRLAALPSDEAALERVRLLGSPVAAGIIDVVLRMEAERPVAVVERRLEHAIDGVYRFRGPDGEREIAIRGIADRIDLLEDGTFRIVDYKSSKPATALQIALYAVCTRQTLAGYRGREWALAEAAYVVFRGDQPIVPLAKKPEDIEPALADAEAQAVTMTDAIVRGEFPPRPRTRSLCTTCAYASVCRKDYVEAGTPAPAV